jgi:hypothetical protein
VKATEKLRCSDCGITDEYPDVVTAEDVKLHCPVCTFHRHHYQDVAYHPRCAICRAREWRLWLLALRIFISRPLALRSEDL